MLWENKRGRKIESRYKILTNVVSISIIPTTKMKWELINLLVNRKRRRWIWFWICSMRRIPR